MAEIVVRGARVHNLDAVDVTLPRDRLVVITGPSGSGKSSLAVDTIFAEGQRRYVESLSAHARRYLDRSPRPDVDLVEGLCPAICIEQRPPGRNPRSTVGTITEIHDHLRLLFATVGEPRCPDCGRSLAAQTVQQMADEVLALEAGTRLSVVAPLFTGRRGGVGESLADLRRRGFVRVRLDGALRDLGEALVVDDRRPHSLAVVVDRLAARASSRQRLTESLELALSLAGGVVEVAIEGGEVLTLSERFACPDHGAALETITPRTFSFNSPQGACGGCGGIGTVRVFDEALVVPDVTLSLAEGAVAPWGKPGASYHRHMLDAVAGLGVDVEAPWEALSARHRGRLLRGHGDFEGVLPGLDRRAREYERRKREEGADEEQTLEYLEDELGRYAVRSRCPECEGARLRRGALAVTVGGHGIRELSALSIRELREVLARIELSDKHREVADRSLRELTGRLGFLADVGLDYLCVDRAASTLSGGEAGRIRLATQIGAGLSGVLYVLDEPSAGLHPRDTERLLGTLRGLRDRGNSVLIVEHDPAIVRAADQVVDMGPGAGARGGRVVAQGTPEEIAACEESSTGAFLSGRRTIPVPSRRRKGRGAVRIAGAVTHNLRSVDVTIPLGVLTVVTGVSGSGKSSLVVDTLLPAARRELSGARVPAPEARVTGLARLDKVVDVTQAALGRTPRSSPASYTGLLTLLRGLFAGLPEARARGYRPGRFSFNVKGGRCEACRGDGVIRVEMYFLPDVYVRCEQCDGRRYNRETLEIRYRGHSVADVLDMSVDEASDLLGNFPKLAARLAALREVGLGYLALGRSATTLSGGEAQRVRLAKELARRATGRTLYVLDEPTTGLHWTDVELLVAALHRLVDAGNTVVVVEHSLDVVRVADHVVDLGPEGGDAGGEVVVTGTPEDVMACEASHTGRHLRGGHP